MSGYSRHLPVTRSFLASIIATAAFIPSFAAAQVPPEMRREATSLMQLCRGDYDRLCSGVTPGGGRVLACLQAHSDKLNPACAEALPRAEALRDAAVKTGVMPK